MLSWKEKRNRNRNRNKNKKSYGSVEPWGGSADHNLGLDCPVSVSLAPCRVQLA